MPRTKKKTKRKTKSAKDGVINVTLVLAGQQTNSYGLHKGQTVRELFDIAEANMDGEIRLNNRLANGDTKITKNKSEVMAVPRINGA